MEPNDQIRLRMNQVNIVKSLRAKDIVDYLFEEGIISDENMEEISESRTTKDGTRNLLKILPQKGPTAFKIFIEKLREIDLGFLADQIENSDPSSKTFDLDSASTSSKRDEPDSASFEALRRQVSRQEQFALQTKDELMKLRNESRDNAERYNLLKQKLSEMEDDAISNGLTEKEINDKLVGIIDRFKASEPIAKSKPKASVNEGTSTQSEMPIVKDVPEGIITSEGDDDLPRDAIRIEARLLGLDIVHYVAETKTVPPPNKHCKTMRKTVLELLSRYKYFDTVFDKLSISEETSYQTFAAIANEVLIGGDINWGRIVSLYAFSGALAKYCIDKGNPQMVNSIGEFTGKYMANHLCDWIIQNHGWDAFDEYFPDKTSDEEWKFSKMLLSAVGLGLLGAAVIIRK